MASVAFKNRTRDEIIAAFRESIRKKDEWIKQSDEEFKRIREERSKLAI
ncbi:MAG: 30S ribosomal protein S7 [Prevotella sp.]|nr:30S ribosomal protein S7 [Prevotella sp.]